MKKTLFFAIIAVIALFAMATSVQAATTLTELQTELTTGSTTEVELTEAIIISDTVNLDLNGKTLKLNFDDSILAQKGGIKVDGGKLTITNGTIETSTVGHMIMVTNGGYVKVEKATLTSTKAGGTAIVARGASLNTDVKNQVVLANDAILNADYGVNVFGQKNTDANAYDVVIDIYGTINAENVGVCISGNVNQTEGDVPEIYIHDGARIIAEKTGIYAAGYGIWEIDAATISGKGSGLGIKSGKIVLNNTTVSSNGVYATPVGNGNGISPTGAAIQVEAYKNYAGKIDLTINGGKYTSENNSALLEYTTSTENHTFIEEISILGGEFVSADNIDTIAVSESFEEEILQIKGGFVTGGTFSSDINEFLSNEVTVEEDANGNKVVVPVKYTVTIDNKEYTVETGKTVKDIEEYNDIIKREGYEFVEFQTEDGKEFDETTKIEEDTVLKTVFKVVEKEEEKEENKEEDKELENTEENKKEESKDETPKTGMESLALPLFTLVAVISLAGIIINRKK